jgi:hypothetical protein
MAGKKLVVEDYEPTLNGHPILTVNNVIAWFKERNCDVRERFALAIAERLNEYEFLGAFWKDTPELKASRRNNPSALRNIRVADAIKTLQEDLPSLIDDTLRVVPSNKLEALRPFYGLLVDINSVASRFSSVKPPARGRTHAGWHIVARKIGTQIVGAWHASTGRRVGLGKATSPAVEITQKALAYLGVKAKRETIVDAVRAKRTRSPKRLGK